MAKRARVKGKGADIFFDDAQAPAEGTSSDQVEALRAENERLTTEIKVLRKRIELLEKEVEPLRKENEELRKRVKTYADAFAKLLVHRVTSEEILGALLDKLGANK